MTDRSSTAERRELLARATPGPWEHMEGSGLVRAIRGDVAIPLLEARMPWHDPAVGAPTVRAGGEVLFRKNSEGAHTSQAFRREWYNAAVTAAAVNDYARHLDMEEALAWLASDRRLSIYHYAPIYGDDDDQREEWRVDRESGSINDREWTTLGRGPTPLAALQSALTGDDHVQ